jgi:pSer/pThr/pTyr-binding forkhead associated (FHA) protein
MELTLEIVEGPDAGWRAPLRQPLVIGRASTADLTLDDERASREHARISPEGGGAVVEDLGSRNGTYLNQNEVHGPARLRPGDEVVIGVTVLAVRSPTDVARQPSAVRAVPPPLAVPEGRPDFVAPARGGGNARTHDAGGADTGIPELDRLVDRRVRGKARMAPLAVFVLAALIVVIYLGLQ